MHKKEAINLKDKRRKVSTKQVSNKINFSEKSVLKKFHEKFRICI